MAEPSRSQVAVRLSAWEKPPLPQVRSATMAKASVCESEQVWCASQLASEYALQSEADCWLLTEQAWQWRLALLGLALQDWVPLSRCL